MRQPAASGHAAQPPSRHAHDGDAACAHATDRLAQAGMALAEADRICRLRGVRLTPIRRDVLASLHATHRPLGAYDIIETLAGQDSRRLAPISIYRALDFLMEQGLVHRLATRNAFVACPHRHDERDRIAFLICDSCGGVDEIFSPDLSDALGRLFAAQDFSPRRPVLEVAGSCAHCHEVAHDAAKS